MNDVEQSLQALDARIESRVQAIRGERDWWPCQRGCDHCCCNLAHPPELSLAEWERVDRAVVELPESAKATIAQKIDALLQQIAEKTLTASVACPYLNEQEGSCYIYDSRPIACRTYGFFVARHHDQYCNLIETQIHDREDHAVVWGNADAICNEVERISGKPISFEMHYRDRGIATSFEGLLQNG